MREDVALLREALPARPPARWRDSQMPAWMAARYARAEALHAALDRLARLVPDA